MESIKATQDILPYENDTRKGCMNTNVTNMQEQDYFSPTVHEAVTTAQRKAVSMNATEVSPEHLFLGILAQDNDGITEAFNVLKLNQAMLREQVLTLFPSHTVIREEKSDVPLSPETQTCIDWAISFAMYQYASSVQLEHILLGCVRHQRLQPLLALFLINAGSMLPFSLTGRSGRAYTASMDQSIFSRIRQQRGNGISNRILSSFERPTTLFSDIGGFHSVKQDLREVMTFLRNPQRVQQDMNVYLYGLLFIGSSGTSRTSLVHAIAGEAGVPLLSLSLAVLVEMIHASSSGSSENVGTTDSASQPSKAERERVAVYGRQILHDLFERGKEVSPCVVYIDGLDVLTQPEIQDVCMQWQSQLCGELDDCDRYMTVVATTRSHEQIDSSLLIPSRFAHTATLDGTPLRHFEVESVLCSTCQQEVPTYWKYCGFCGAARARTCSQCGAILPEVKGVHFCPTCGERLEEK